MEITENSVFRTKKPILKPVLIILAFLSIGSYWFEESFAAGDEGSWKSESIRQPELDVRTGRLIVYLARSSNFNLYDALIWEAAVSAGIEPNLWKAVVMIESAGNSMAVSHKGAMGLSQIMPNTADYLGLSREKIMDPKANLRAGASYLSWLLVRFGGNLEHALAAYNAGPERVRRHGGVPSYQETRQYVRSILAMYRWLQSHPQAWSHSHRNQGIATTLLPPGLQVASVLSIPS